MTKKDAIKIFEDKKIRAVWDDKKKNGFSLSWTLLQSLPIATILADIGVT